MYSLLLGFPSVSGGRGVKGRVSESQLEPRNGTSSTAGKQKLQNCVSRDAITRYAFTYIKHKGMACFVLYQAFTDKGDFVQSVRSKIQISFTPVSHYR